jgi:ribosomal protein S18 acetylase RimI-like enzyme
MIVYKQADSLKELEQILALQQRNLPKNISQEESTKEGFVTVEHSLGTLKSMNDVCGHIIAMDDGQVVGYALCMHPKFSEDIEVLRPMFKEIGMALNDDVRYMVMGQICVAKSHRNQGVFRKLYQTMKEKLPMGFDTIVTEVDGKNKRSLDAHTAIGFQELRRYYADHKEWVIIIL